MQSLTPISILGLTGTVLIAGAIKGFPDFQNYIGKWVDQQQITNQWTPENCDRCKTILPYAIIGVSALVAIAAYAIFNLLAAGIVAGAVVLPLAANGIETFSQEQKQLRRGEAYEASKTHAEVAEDKNLKAQHLAKDAADAKRKADADANDARLAAEKTQDAKLSPDEKIAADAAAVVAIEKAEKSEAEAQDLEKKASDAWDVAKKAKEESTKAAKAAESHDAKSLSQAKAKLTELQKKYEKEEPGPAKEALNLEMSKALEAVLAMIN